jgi:hypothetical protein
MSDADDLFDLADQWFLTVKDVHPETLIRIPARDLLRLTAAVFAQHNRRCDATLVSNDAASEVRTSTFCGAFTLDGRGRRVYCTREPGHPARHVATIGPYQAGMVVLAEWASPEPPRATDGPASDTPPE